jgi:hypothetical protein
MHPVPLDIFTEPTDVDPDTLANLGPLRPLAGVWRAQKGMDVNPKAEGPERRVFIETNHMHAIDPQTNGPQLLYGLRYHIHINTAEEDITFHEQVGYWLWEPATGLVLQSLAIPRGQVALAAGHAKPKDKTFYVASTRGTTDYGICSTDFLDKFFRTDSYRIEITCNPDDSWSYFTHTRLGVHGDKRTFDHIDRNTLRRIGPAQPNPLARILARRKSAASGP